MSDGNHYPPLRVTVLGSGTSAGIPVIGCNCPVCTSTDPRNKRLRSSIRIDAGGKTILVDCGVDLRQQLLAHPTPNLDAVLITHSHSDHVNGLDDLRVFNFRQGHDLPIYTSARFAEDIRVRFAYCFNPFQIGGGIPQFNLMEVRSGEMVDVVGLPVMPIEIMHGKLPILGFRLGSFAYLTDCSFISEEGFALLDGVDTLILSSLRHKPHPTHFNIEQSVAASRRIGAKRTFFIHMCDALDHAATEDELPPDIRLTYDGMVLDIP